MQAVSWHPTKQERERRCTAQVTLASKPYISHQRPWRMAVNSQWRKPEDNVVLVAQKGDEIGGGPHEHIIF